MGCVNLNSPPNVLVVCVFRSSNLSTITSEMGVEVMFRMVNGCNSAIAGTVVALRGCRRACCYGASGYSYWTPLAPTGLKSCLYEALLTCSRSSEHRICFFYVSSLLTDSIRVCSPNEDHNLIPDALRNTPRMHVACTESQ